MIPILRKLEQCNMEFRAIRQQSTSVYKEINKSINHFSEFRNTFFFQSHQTNSMAGYSGRGTVDLRKKEGREIYLGQGRKKKLV